MARPPLLTGEIKEGALEERKDDLGRVVRPAQRLVVEEREADALNQTVACRTSLRRLRMQRTCTGSGAARVREILVARASAASAH